MQDHISMLKILSYMSELDGLWKHRNNPISAKNGSLQSVAAGHHMEEEDSFQVSFILFCLQPTFFHSPVDIFMTALLPCALVKL